MSYSRIYKFFITINRESTFSQDLHKLAKMLIEELLQLGQVVQRIWLVLLQSGLDAEVHLRIQVGVNVQEDLQHVVHHVLLLREHLLKPDVLKIIRKLRKFFCVFSIFLFGAGPISFFSPMWELKGFEFWTHKFVFKICFCCAHFGFYYFFSSM